MAGEGKRCANCLAGFNHRGHRGPRGKDHRGKPSQGWSGHRPEHCAELGAKHPRVLCLSGPTGGPGGLLQAPAAGDHRSAAADWAGIHSCAGSLEVSEHQRFGRLEESLFSGSRGWDRLRRSFQSRDPRSEAGRNPSGVGRSAVERLALRPGCAHLPSRSQKPIRTDESRSAQEPGPAPRNPQRIGCASPRGALSLRMRRQRRGLLYF